jgi:hypothetical protein
MVDKHPHSSPLIGKLDLDEIVEWGELGVVEAPIVRCTQR